MGNPTDARVQELERDWPAWQVWYVPRAVGGMTWHARRWDDHAQRLDAESAEELAADLAREAER